jgi:hypothetical protein
MPFFMRSASASEQSHPTLRGAAARRVCFVIRTDSLQEPAAAELLDATDEPLRGRRMSGVLPCLADDLFREKALTKNKAADSYQEPAATFIAATGQPPVPHDRAAIVAPRGSFGHGPDRMARYKNTSGTQGRTFSGSIRLTSVNIELPSFSRGDTRSFD